LAGGHNLTPSLRVYRELSASGEFSRKTTMVRPLFSSDRSVTVIYTRP
jgi:hypothetical protein